MAAAGLTLLLAAAVAIAVVLYGNVTPPTIREVVVLIPQGAGDNLSIGFEPAKITIQIGVNNTVVWKNEDSDYHTAHSNIPEFNSGLIQPGESFTHTFLRAGIYPYHCDPHPWMTGVVTVIGATSSNLAIQWPNYSMVPLANNFSIRAVKFATIYGVSWVVCSRQLETS